MKQPIGQKRRIWFWVGVVLLSVSALLWLIFIWASEEDIGDTVLVGIMFTAIPIAIGVFCVWRGKKASTAEMNRETKPTLQSFREASQSIRNVNDNGSKIVFKLPWWFRVVAWLVLLIGLLIFLTNLGSILAGEGEDAFWGAGISLSLAIVGIWMVGMTTKVTFDKPLGHITVIRGHLLFFLWFFRTKRISRGEAKSAFACVVDHWWDEHSHHEVRVVANSGREVKLLDAGRYQDAADYIAKRIKGWAEEVAVTNQS